MKILPNGKETKYNGGKNERKNERRSGSSEDGKSI